jgi:hypothetical protein
MTPFLLICLQQLLYSVAVYDSTMQWVDLKMGTELGNKRIQHPFRNKLWK